MYIVTELPLGKVYKLLTTDLCSEIKPMDILRTDTFAYSDTAIPQL